jgi:hypothetical protein
MTQGGVGMAGKRTGRALWVMSGREGEDFQKSECTTAEERLGYGRRGCSETADGG